MGPLNETTIEAVWRSFGSDLPAVAAKHQREWLDSIELLVEQLAAFARFGFRILQEEAEQQVKEQATAPAEKPTEPAPSPAPAGTP